MSNLFSSLAPLKILFFLLIFKSAYALETGDGGSDEFRARIESQIPKVQKLQEKWETDFGKDLFLPNNGFSPSKKDTYIEEIGVLNECLEKINLNENVKHQWENAKACHSRSHDTAQSLEKALINIVDFYKKDGIDLLNKPPYDHDTIVHDVSTYKIIESISTDYHNIKDLLETYLEVKEGIQKYAFADDIYLNKVLNYDELSSQTSIFLSLIHHINLSTGEIQKIRSYFDSVDTRNTPINILLAESVYFCRELHKARGESPFVSDNAMFSLAEKIDLSRNTDSFPEEGDETTTAFCKESLKDNFEFLQNTAERYRQLSALIRVYLIAREKRISEKDMPSFLATLPKDYFDPLTGKPFLFREGFFWGGARDKREEKLLYNEENSLKIPYKINGIENAGIRQ
ncbi:MAG: hypothetical protein H6862_01180 [Rhodospirillales bacterium]|nr:hypothetical protein [Rhodospirillales bacterium]